MRQTLSVLFTITTINKIENLCNANDRVLTFFPSRIDLIEAFVNGGKVSNNKKIKKNEE